MSKIDRIFVDTSTFVALFNERDEMHYEAIRLLEEIKNKRIRLVVTDYILSESITTTLARASHKAAVTVGEFILGSHVIDLIWLDKPFKFKAWEFFKKHSDKSYFFIDCTSFIVMKEMKVNHYFAFDEDFVKTGFIDFASK
ncbi:PIN domain nuclease [Dissulfurispira thermophila]|uniref:PIN domain nuclease n=1 Tax=Dissulfurispira thermophila TaxID=2715679 RepID=A0A7G1H2T4_9BACT|nr:PIN domain-containing protein [Dissulfurispira thermophila]BCB96017.1 PIN domain nuclease [Dissulfurispira thermophila]